MQSPDVGKSCYFDQPNLLVLDEPTNDLDIEMLEVLEQKLVEFTGTLILVSHDRAFMDNVVTSTLVFEDNGDVVDYPGGFSDWVARGRTLRVALMQLLNLPNPARRRPKNQSRGSKPTWKTPAANCNENWSSYRRRSKPWNNK